MANNRAQILITAVDETRRAFQSINGSLSQLRDQAGQVSSVLTRIGAAVGVGLGARELITIADQYKNLQSRLRLAVTSQAEFNLAQNELFQIAQRNRAPLAETVTLYARLAPSVQALGRSQAEVLAATDAIGQAVALSGASAEAASAALVQLGQAFASGQLRGEEFNSVIEQTPRLAQAIADGMGVPLGSLRALAKEGKVTSQAVLDALLTQRERLAAEYGSLPDTVSGAITRLKNAFQRALGEQDSGLGVTSGLAQAIQLIAARLDVLINLAGIALVAAFGRMVSAFFASIAATRAETVARIANLRVLEAEAIARAALAQAALTQAQAQGVATATLAADLARAQAQASAASVALASATAASSLFGRVVGALRSILALLGGPVGLLVTGVTLLAAAIYSARDAVVEFGGRTASLRQIARATWDLALEKLRDFGAALTDLVGLSGISWSGIRDSAVTALEFIGSAFRTLINTALGVFTAIGQTASIAAAFLTERFGNAFADIRSFARALNEDLARVFAGDFSMTALEGSLGRSASRLREIGGDLAAAVRESFARDYVGEAAAVIARRIRPDAASTALFGQTQRGSDRTTAETSATARATLEQARADAQFKILKDALDRQTRAIDQALEDRLISLAEYYAAKTQLEQTEIDAEIARNQRALDAQQRSVDLGKDDAAKLKAQGEIAKLEAELIVLNTRRADVEVRNARRAADAERDLRDELAKVRAELLDLTGVSSSADRRGAIVRQYEPLLARLRAEDDTEGVTTVGRLIDVKAASADLAAYEEQFNLALSRMRTNEQSINVQRETGLLTEAQARTAILALHRETAIALEAILPQLEAAAMAIGPEAVARVQAWRNEIAQVKVVVDDVALAIDGAVRDGFAQLFEDIGRGAKSAKEAFGDFARSVLQAINRIASQKLAESLFARLFGSPTGGGGGGLGAFISSLLGFASGGYVRGPGSSTSDSIPARLSDGEYVINARAVSRVGVSFLDALNGLSIGPQVRGPALAFASGGLVTTPAEPLASGQNIRIVNVIDPAMAADYLNSSAGERVVMNLIQRNATSVRNILGR